MIGVNVKRQKATGVHLNAGTSSNFHHVIVSVQSSFIFVLGTLLLAFCILLYGRVTIFGFAFLAPCFLLHTIGVLLLILKPIDRFSMSNLL